MIQANRWWTLLTPSLVYSIRKVKRMPAAADATKELKNHHRVDRRTTPARSPDSTQLSRCQIVMVRCCYRAWYGDYQSSQDLGKDIQEHSAMLLKHISIACIHTSPWSTPCRFDSDDQQHHHRIPQILPRSPISKPDIRWHPCRLVCEKHTVCTNLLTPGGQKLMVLMYIYTRSSKPVAVSTGITYDTLTVFSMGVLIMLNRLSCPVIIWIEWSFE